MEKATFLKFLIIGGGAALSYYLFGPIGLAVLALFFLLKKF